MDGWQALCGREGVEGALSSVFEGRAFRFALAVFVSLEWIDRRQTRCALRGERKAAPGPILGMNDEAALHRIHVHVLEFLDSLLMGGWRRLTGTRGLVGAALFTRSVKGAGLRPLF